MNIAEGREREKKRVSQLSPLRWSHAWIVTGMDLQFNERLHKLISFTLADNDCDEGSSQWMRIEYERHSGELTTPVVMDFAVLGRFFLRRFKFYRSPRMRRDDESSELEQRRFQSTFFSLYWDFFYSDSYVMMSDSFWFFDDIWVIARKTSIDRKINFVALEWDVKTAVWNCSILISDFLSVRGWLKMVNDFIEKFK